MTIQALKEFIGRHSVSAGALTALGAALDAKANGAVLDPVLTQRIQDLLQVLGARELVEGVDVQEADAMLTLIRTLHAVDSKLLSASTRTRGWDYHDVDLLQGIGQMARGHAQEVTRVVVPGCAGLAERLSQAGARLIDIGVGVAGTAIALARMWPELSIVGIDPWQPSLKLARENVEAAGLSDRIELREQRAETLEDSAAFDMVWFALPFVPERVIHAGLERSLRAARSGGWIVAGGNATGLPTPLAELMWVRMAQWGGPLWTPPEMQRALEDAGFVDVRAIPQTPGSMASFVVGRKA